MVKLTCVAHGGYPAPTVSIYRNDSQLVTSREHVTLNYRLDETDSLAPFVCRSKTDGLTDIVESNRKVFFFNSKCRYAVCIFDFVIIPTFQRKSWDYVVLPVCPFFRQGISLCNFFIYPDAIITRIPKLQYVILLGEGFSMSQLTISCGLVKISHM